MQNLDLPGDASRAMRHVQLPQRPRWPQIHQRHRSGQPDAQRIHDHVVIAAHLSWRGLSRRASGRKPRVRWQEQPHSFIASPSRDAPSILRVAPAYLHHPMNSCPSSGHDHAGVSATFWSVASKRLFDRRTAPRIVNPIIANPSSSISHVDGSGTAPATGARLAVIRRSSTARP